MEILRFITAGSVDDGKSTLIGRLLYDTRSLPQDTLEYLEKPKNRLPDGNINLALLTDGLRAEREQGITIDVAYKYFATDRRKFIIADAPGHVQYTRNMVTGASQVQLAIILVDARHGVIEQTHRHSYIASLLGIRHLVVAVNKMDLVNWSEERFREIEGQYRDFAGKLDIHDIQYVPVSALHGDNIVHPSAHTPWYLGRPLLSILEEAPVEGDYHLQAPRFPVQYVIRPQSSAFPDYRGYAGQIAGGIFRVGDSIVALPGGQKSRIKAIRGLDQDLDFAFSPQSVTILLEDEIDISRGDMLVRADALPLMTRELDAWICWMDHVPLKVGKRYTLRQGPRSVKAVIQHVEYVVDINTFEKRPDLQVVQLNDIARVRIRLAGLLPHDPYAVNRQTGNFILIDDGTHQTVAAGTIQHNPLIPNQISIQEQTEGYVI